tara:strand:+ start:1337 stop:1627 length:291 start_codon:yes stop_codon:yes gene_type:complete
MGNIILPQPYSKLAQWQRKEVREQYIEEQDNKCWYCKCDIYKDAPQNVLDKPINLDLFPPFFLKNPIHLQHNHESDMTEGAVHAYCNAVLWQYHGR